MCFSPAWAQEVDISKNAPLRIGTTADFPPIIYKTDDGKYAGLEADMAEGLGEALERPVEWIELNWDELVPALEEKRVDVLMAGIPVTRDLKHQINFSHTYADFGQVALVRDADLDKYTSRTAVTLMTGTVGVGEGTSAEVLVKEEFFSAQLRVFQDTDPAIQALLNGELNAIVCDLPMVWWMQENYDGVSAVMVRLSRESIAWGFHKDDKELLELANQALDDWKFTGDLMHALENYLPFLMRFSEDDNEAKRRSQRRFHRLPTRKNAFPAGRSPKDRRRRLGRGRSVYRR